MTLECEPSRFEIHHMNTIHTETRTTPSPPPRLASATIPPPLRGHDTLASLYKRYTTLNQQIRSTRLLLEQQQSENQHTLALAAARDRANGKLQRKLDQQLSATPPLLSSTASASSSSSSPDSSHPPLPLTPATKANLQARKLNCALVHDEYQQWQASVQRHQNQLEQQTYRTSQAQQQLLCLQHIHTTSTDNKQQQHSQRYQDLEMRHALLETLNAIRDLYVDALDTMATRWAWLLEVDDNNNNNNNNKHDTTNNNNDDDQVIHTTPATTYKTRLDQLKQDYQQHLDQERALQLEVNALATAHEEEEEDTL